MGETQSDRRRTAEAALLVFMHVNATPATTNSIWRTRILSVTLTLAASTALFPGTASADSPDNQNIISASPEAVLSFERPEVTTIDTTPKKPEHINVLPSTTGVKRPMPGTLSAPLLVLNESSPFGIRTSPITGEPLEEHLGQDYASPCGTSVYAADSGKVIFSGWHPYGGGNRVEIDHGDGIITTYNHMESNAVHVGDIVDVGAVVGHVGTTGSSTGCHLHFETMENGKTHVDPKKWPLVPITLK